MYFYASGRGNKIGDCGVQLGVSMHRDFQHDVPSRMAYLEGLQNQPDFLALKNKTIIAQETIRIQLNIAS